MSLLFQTPFGVPLTLTTSGQTVMLTSQNLQDTFVRNVDLKGTVSLTTVSTSGSFTAPTITPTPDGMRLDFANAKTQRFDYSDSITFAYTGEIQSAHAHLASLPDGSSFKTTAVIPEPATAFMFIAAFTAIFILRRAR